MDADPPPSRSTIPRRFTVEDTKRASSFERGLDNLVAWLNGAVKDSVVVAVHRVRPDTSMATAEKLAVIRRDLERIEGALRAQAAQGTFAGLVMEG